MSEQTQQKLAGERYIEQRLVSLDDADARPIKKGKAFPRCEFGSTVQMTFNRQGYMITSENFIGSPSDKTLYLPTIEKFKQRMKVYPTTSVTDLGYRSRTNLKNAPQEISHVFMGRSTDVSEDQRKACHSARSATEGFIAVAKNLRGFKKSPYWGNQGHRIWTKLCHISYNLRKFLLCYHSEGIEEESLLRLSLATL